LFKKAKIIITTDEVEEEPKAEVKPQPTAKPKQEQNKTQPKQEKVEKKETKHENDVEQTTQTAQQVRPNNETTKEFVVGLLDVLKIKADVELKEEEEVSVLTVNSADAGVLIGHRGDGLNALQYLCNVVEDKKNPHSKKVLLDIEGYKERREQSLKGLAKRCADKVLKTHKSYKLEPMNAYERRIIHTELQSIEGITTISIGEEPNRRIVIDIAK
jgi:spoIIIJ-associated protein